MENPKNININQFDYNLPDEHIAKYPLENRDESKLLVYDKGIINSAIYKDLADFLPSNAHLVFNNTKVIQARMFFKKPTGAIIEIFCLEPSGLEIVTAMSATERVSWNCILGNAKRWKNEIGRAHV